MEEKQVHRRVWSYYGIIIACLLIIVGRLWYLQIMQGEYYGRLADGNRMRQLRVTPARGVIYDRNYQPLVRSRRAFTVSLVPEGIPEGGETMRLLAEILHMTHDELKEAVDRGRGLPYEPVRLVRDVDIATVFAIEERRRLLPGVFIEEEPVREYLHQHMASHILGHMGTISRSELQALGTSYRGSDLVGKTGLERVYEQELRGEHGTLMVEVNALSRPIQTVGAVPAKPGNNLVLALDAELQSVAKEAFLQHTATIREEYPNAHNGAVVALNPKTGEILAMVSIPEYEPERLLMGGDRNQYYMSLERDPNLPFFNRAIHGQYGPGSSFKCFIAVAILEEGVYPADRLFNATGVSRYGVRDWVITQGIGALGPITMTEALAISSNHYFAEHSLGVGIDRLAPWLRQFGFGQPTGILFQPGEALGLVPDREWKALRFAARQRSEQVWYPTDTEQISIGQGFVTATPLQLALAFSGIANRGTIYAPILVKEMLAPDGGVVFASEPEVLRSIPASTATWQSVINGMRAAITHPRGTARRAFEGASYTVAGKTGSYEHAVESGRPKRDANGLFGAFAPVDNPELVVMVVVEHGGGGGGAAAPIARKVFDAYFEGQKSQE